VGGVAKDELSGLDEYVAGIASYLGGIRGVGFDLSRVVC
jgi:hypothetical protein